MSRAVTLANFASGEALTLDETNDRVGIASTSPDATLDIKNTILMDGDAGIITATSFSGSGSALSGINASGLTGTPDITVNNIVAVGATFSGVLTYEDVTNVDSIGIITARSGVAYGTGIGATISSPATNTLALGTNSAERLRVTSAGLVGINQTVPEALLHIEASSSGASYTADAADTLILERNGGCVIDFRTPSANDGGLIFSDNDARGQGSVLYNHSTNILSLATAGSQRLSISAGIITSYGSDIQIHGTAGIASCTWDASANSLIFKDESYAKFGDSSDLSIYHGDGNSTILNSTGVLTVKNTGSGKLQLMTQGAQDVEIKTNNELSIKCNDDGAVEVYYDASKKLETTNTGATITGVTTTTQLAVGPGIIQENLFSEASAATGAGNYDIGTRGLTQYYTSNTSGTFTINLRWDGSTALNTKLNVGSSIVFTVYYAQNNTSYYMTDFLIDGASQTEKWVGGTAPSAGGGSGVDCYTFNILKTANATFTVMANHVNFA